MTQLTIGMPVYNGVTTIRAALDSLLAQTFEDFAIVISDNGSCDGTEAICREYEAYDKRIRYVRQPSNLGAAMNFRFVLFEARTPLFMWAAADDLWSPVFVAAHVAVLEQNPGVVASQSKVLFTVGGVASHLSTGTYALPFDARRNAALFFRNPADNSRYYGVFRTAALQAVFPIRNFHALDWAVSASTLRYGSHVEVPSVLMIRDSSDELNYARQVLSDHRFVLWRIFPLLFMTKWLLLRRRVPISLPLLVYLTKVNLYLHFRFGLYRWGRLADRYLKTNSARATVRGALADIIQAAVQPGLRQRLAVGASRIRGQAYGLAHRAWRLVPLTLEQREAAKRRVFRLLGRRASRLPAYRGWVVGTPLASQGSTWAPGPPPSLPTAGWKRPMRLAGPLPAVAVIVVVEDDVVGTLALLDTLASAQDDLPMEIVVVDNGSTDTTVFLGGICPEVVHVRLPRSLPYGAAVMAGVAKSVAGNLIFIEQKSLVRPGFAKQMLAGLERADLAGAQARYPDDRLRSAGGVLTVDFACYGYGRGGGPSEPEYLFAREVDYCPSAFAVRRATLEAAGGIAPEYDTFEIAAVDLSIRLKNGGKRLLYWPEAIVVDYTGAYDPAAREYVHSAAWMRDWSEVITRHASFFRALDQSNCPRERWHDRSRLKRLLYIDADTPCPDQNSGSNDAINLMAMLNELGFRISFVPESNFVHRDKYTDELHRLGIHTIYYPFFATVREVLERLGHEFDVVIGCRAYIAEKYFDAIREMAPQARIVFNTVDLNALRLTREAAMSNDPAQMEAAKAHWVSELASIAKADATIVVSTYERQIISEKLPNARVHVIPLLRDLPRHLDVPGFASRGDLMFVGTYQHPPNVDAAIYFVTQIWPLIRERLPDARFLVVGSSVTPEIRALAGNGVEVLGFVEDLDGLLARLRLTVAPLRWGAGLKGKVVSSLGAGVPVVATSMAVEGSELEHERDVLVADTPQEFADAVVRLYTDQELWQRLSELGFEYARKEYTIDVNRGRVLALFGEIGQLSDLELMQAEIAAADPLYQPSKFWDMLNEKNTWSIKRNIHLFKRSINNNYFQWLPGSFEDVQVRNLVKFWHQHLSLIPIEVVSDSGAGYDTERVKEVNDYWPFDNPSYPTFYSFFVGLLWYYAACNDAVRLHERLEEPQLGGPLPIRHGARLISQDLANSLQEWSRVQTLTQARVLPDRPRILELGAGYGRLAYVFLTAQRCRYVIVDIPPALMIAKWYLTSLFPTLKVFGFRRFSDYALVAADIEAADICFLTSNQLALLPTGFADVSVAISSLHEMRFDQIANYKALLEEKTRSVIYFKHWTRWTNPSDGITVAREDFLLGDGWQLVLDCPHPIHDEMTELGFLRREEQSSPDRAFSQAGPT